MKRLSVPNNFNRLIKYYFVIPNIFYCCSVFLFGISVVVIKFNLNRIAGCNGGNFYGILPLLSAGEKITDQKKEKNTG